MYTLEQVPQKNIKELKEIGCQLNVFPTTSRRCRQNWINALARLSFPLLALLETSSCVEVQVQEPIAKAVEASSAKAAENSPGVEVDRVQEPKSIAHELLQLFKSSVRIQEPIETFPGVKTELTKLSLCGRSHRRPKIPPMLKLIVGRS
jgi:hypothetical protein